MSNPIPELVTMTESEFDTKYEPIGLERDGSGTLWREEHEIPEDLERNHLWTVVEGDEGTCYIPDWHFVNRVAYVVTKVPWEHMNIEVKVDGPDDEEEDGAPCCPAPQDHDTKDGTCDFPGYADNH